LDAEPSRASAGRHIDQDIIDCPIANPAGCQHIETAKLKRACPAFLPRHHALEDGVSRRPFQGLAAVLHRDAA
jgi:hypothetical protein